VKLVSRTAVRHTGKYAVVSWTMAYQLGVKGFRVYAKSHNLTPKLIKPHKSNKYSTRVAWTNNGHYTLHTLLKNGHTRTKAIH